MEKRTKEIKIRLTETEHQRLLDRCDRTHLAEWLRQLGLGEHISRKRRVPEVAPELLRQVKRDWQQPEPDRPPPEPG